MIQVKNTTKITFFVTLLCLLICTSMLAGTTFALFTDYEVIEQNRVISGTLDMELNNWDHHENNSMGGYVDATYSELFHDDIWAPGHMEVAYLEVKNIATLAMKYEINITAKETPYVNEHGKTVMTSDFLVGKIICAKQLDSNSQMFQNREEVLMQSGIEFDLKSVYEEGGFIVKPGESGYFAFMVYMPIEVTTEAAPDGDIEAEKSRIHITIDVVATQAAHEADGFGDTYYDAHHTYPIISSDELRRDLTWGGILSFAKDVTDESELTNAVSKDIVVDLNRMTLNTGAKDAFVVTEGANLKLQGNGVINTQGNCVDIQDGTVTVLSGTYNGGIRIGANGKLVVRGGSFVGFDPTEYLAPKREVTTSVGANGETIYTVS